MRFRVLLAVILSLALVVVLAVRIGSHGSPSFAPVGVAAPAPPHSPPVVAAAPPPAPPPVVAGGPNPLTGEVGHKHLFLPQKLPPPPAGSSPLPVPVGSAAPPPLPNFGQLADGNALWQGPASMVVGDTSPVGITIGPDTVLAKDLQAALANAVGAAGTAQSGTSAVQISPRMTASATGVGFDITPAGAQEQEVSFTAPTTWSWQATATQAGMHYIMVTLTAELPGGARLTTLNRPIGGIVVSAKPLTFQQKLDSVVIPFLTSIKAIVVLVAAILTTIFSKPVIAFLRRMFGRPADRAKGAAPPPG